MRRFLALCVCLVAAGTIPADDATPPRSYSPLYAFARRVDRAVGDNADPSRGNRLAIIDDGYDALLLRVHLIRHAKRSIDIQTLILENDECGRLITYELIQAAKRGVAVRLLADHFMSAQDRDWVAFLASAHPNLQLKYYRPPARFIKPPKLVALVNSLVFFYGTNQRMHNKIMLFDDVIAITGGRNIDNHYYNHSTSYNFIDRDAVVVGPILPAIRRSFEAFWDYRRSVPSGKLADVAAVIKRGGFDRPEAWDEFGFHGFFSDIDRDSDNTGLIREHFVNPFMPVQRLELLADSPGKNRGFLLWMWGGGKHTKRIKGLMKGTEHSLVMQSPYLVLNRMGRMMFRKVRRKHPDVDVVVSTNSFAATDNTLAYSANFKLRSIYIEALGFRIHEYKPHPVDLLARLPNYPDLERRAREAGETRPPFLSIHAKSYVRDDRIAYIGTHNIDPRSENLNTEVGLLIEDEAIAKKLEATILSATTPESSWVVARKTIPLAEVNYLIEGISGLTPVDIWPLRNTSCFELIPGKEPLPPDHDDFYEHYTDVGSFPGAEGISTKEIVTYLYKVLNTLAIPMI